MIKSKSLVEVGLSMVLKDQFSKQAGQISNSFRAMMNDMNTWNRGIQMSAGNSFEMGKELIGSMAKAYQHSAQVADQIFLTSRMAGANAAQEAELMRLTKEVNERTPLTAQDIASGEKYLAMAGNSVEQIKAMIGPASELASIFGMNLGEKGGVADLMTNIMQTFNLPSQDATKVVDQLATAAVSANVSLQDLAQSFQYSGAEFRNAKISMGDAAAAIGVLGNQGIQASSAGTSLANMMRYLTLSITGQKTKGTSMLKNLGIDPNSLIDSQGNLLRLDKMIAIIGDKLRNRRGIDISSALYNIFGTRGTRAASALLQDYWTGANKLTELMDKISNSEGMVTNLTQARLQTPAGIMSQFTSTLENTVNQLGNTLSTLFNPTLKAGTAILRIVNDIQETWAGKFLVKVIATGTILKTLSVGFRTISGTIRAITTYSTANNTKATQQLTTTKAINNQYIAMETHLVGIGNLLREIAILQAASSMGLTRNSKGQWINKKTGRFAKAPYLGIPVFAPLIGKSTGSGTGTGPAGKSFNGGGSMLGSGTSTFARWGLKHGLGKGLTRNLGRVIAVAGKFAGPWGYVASIGIPLLIDVITSLTSSVDKNTDALNSKEDEKANLDEKNKQAIVDAIRDAIRDGFKGTKIDIAIDGSNVGAITPGTEQDYMGTLLGLQ